MCFIVVYLPKSLTLAHSCWPSSPQEPKWPCKSQKERTGAVLWRVKRNKCILWQYFSDECVISFPVALLAHQDRVSPHDKIHALTTSWNPNTRAGLQSPSRLWSPERNVSIKEDPVFWKPHKSDQCLSGKIERGAIRLRASCPYRSGSRTCLIGRHVERLWRHNYGCLRVQAPWRPSKGKVRRW